METPCEKPVVKEFYPVRAPRRLDKQEAQAMPGSTFQTNPIGLYKLLDECQRGIIQLPDFQRSWVWDEDRIKSLIASFSVPFPSAP